MNWHEYPILRLVVPLVLGILFFMLFPEWAPPLISNLIVLLIIAFLSWPKKYLFPYKHRFISGAIINIAFILIGISLSQYHHSYSDKNYFGKEISTTKYAQATIVEPPENKAHSIKVIIQITKMGSDESIIKTNGIAVLYLQKDSSSQNLEYGNVLVFRNTLKLIAPPQNPDEFNYKRYMDNSGIQYQSFLKTNEWKRINQKGGNLISEYAINSRNYLLHLLKQHGIKDSEFSVAAAMLLGVRSYLSPELRQAFSGAGAMHILCVSGLHVGIIFLILNHFLGFLNRLNRGRLIRSIIIITSIWAYAMITGLSPSVVRAATMFTFISIGQNIGRQVNMFNSLSASAFVLLAINPYLLLDVGFQLSYAAVIAIIALQKPIQNLWTPKWGFLFKIWQLSTVSIAAQIGTAPLALFYFHSFPNYFLLTNLIVIPAAFIIFISGIAVLTFSWAGSFADYLAWILSKFISLLNTFITSVEQLPFAVSKNISISSSQLVILILLSILFSIMFIHKKPKLLIANLSLIVLFLVFDIYQRTQSDQFIVYQAGKYDYISFSHQSSEFAFTDIDVLEYPSLVNYQIREHQIHNHINISKLRDINMPTDELSNDFFQFHEFVSYHKLRFVIIGSDFSQKEYADKINIDYLILCGNPNINMKKLLNTYSCKQIIVSSSNTNWNTKKWMNDIHDFEISNYSIKNNGAFLLNLD